MEKNLDVFRIAWKNSMSSYRQALKAARTEHIRKLIDNHQNNPRFLFSTVARLTNKQMSPDLNISSQFPHSNDFMSFVTDKLDDIRNTITNVDYMVSCTSASFIKEELHWFTTIGQEELNKRIIASKPTTCLLDPVPTKLLIELFLVAEKLLLIITVTNTVHGLPSIQCRRSSFHYIDSHTTQTVACHTGMHFPSSIALITQLFSYLDPKL